MAIAPTMSPEDMAKHAVYMEMKEQMALERMLKDHKMPPIMHTGRTDSEAAMMKKALNQVGLPPWQISNDGTVPMPADLFASTIKWHRATITVFEYLQAQVNFDPFKSDPEAKRIFERILINGYTQLQNEAAAIR